MIEVTGDDIIVRTPKGEAATWTGPKGWLGKLGPLYVVLLKEAMGERILPMWVGTPEGSVLARQLSAISTPHPMTHDLTARLLEVVEAKVERMTVTRLHEITFYATIGVNLGERVHDVNTRQAMC
jgi:bifunctional DNase/RNase